VIGAITAGLFSTGAPPVAPTSYESIATVTVGAGGTSSINFSSIPSTFKHLQIRLLTKNASSNDLYLQFNGDTTSGNYTRHYLFGTGTAAGSGGNVSDGRLSIGYTSTTGSIFGAAVTDVLDYTSTNKNKTIRSLAGFDGNGSGLVVLYSGLWSKTPEAVTSISIFAGAGNINEYSQAALYGIKG
jgi:hypothetical protein